MRIVGMFFAVVVVHQILTMVDTGFGISYNRALAISDIFRVAESYVHHRQTNSTSVATGAAVQTSFLNSGKLQFIISSAEEQLCE
ncbi:hypothetical protein AgCh_010033 [Apium graveolens]